MRQPIWLLLLACVLVLAGAALQAPRESAAGERRIQAAAMPADYLVKHRRRAHNPPHAAAWRCIQRYEGRWNDPSAPYYGGLQMDLGFQRRYGSDLLRTKGTADNWTPVEQMWVAERAYRAGRGFYPWPNTARYCGLI